MKKDFYFTASSKNRIKVSYYHGIGWAGAEYRGSTKPLIREEFYFRWEEGDRYKGAWCRTIEKAYNCSWMFAVKNYGLEENSFPKEFIGKFSEKQTRLLFAALDNHTYEAGDIYSVIFAELENPRKWYSVAVEIKEEGSCIWKAFYYLLKN